MKHESNSRKYRGRGSGGGSGRRSGGENRQKLVDDNGPRVKVKGNASQILEKYLSLARDAASGSDRIAAENYYQHAEHYYRSLHASDERQETPKGPSSGNGKAAAETTPAPRASSPTSEA